MLCLTSEVLKKDHSNADESEVIIDLRGLGLGIVAIAPISLKYHGRGAKQVRIGFTADKRVKIYRRKVFEKLDNNSEGTSPPCSTP